MIRKMKTLEDVMKERYELLEEFYQLTKKKFPSEQSNYNNPMTGRLYHLKKNRLDRQLRENDYWLFLIKDFKPRSYEEDLPTGWMEWALSLDLVELNYD